MPSPKGVPVDTSGNAAFAARYEAVRQAKYTLKAILDEAGIWAKYPPTVEPGKSFQNACDFVQTPDKSKHGVGNALDFDGDRARILATAKMLGMTATADPPEAYTHVEFANGARAPATKPAA